MSRRRALQLGTCLPFLTTSCGGGSGSSPVSESPVVHLAPGRQLVFTYFATTLQSIEETKNHVNALWISHWGDDEDYIKRLRRATELGKRIILDIPHIWNLGEIGTRVFLTMLQNLGILKNIWMLYPIDEPNKPGVDKTDFEVISKNTLLRAVCQDFPELKDVPLGVCYADNSSLPGFHSYDVVSFDSYGNDIFRNGKFDTFRNRLGSHQSLFLVPGGCDPWKEKPDSFVDACNSELRISGIIPFIFLDFADPTAGVGLGIRSNGLLPDYRRLGLEVLANA